jgi:hypothetical protein
MAPAHAPRFAAALCHLSHSPLASDGPAHPPHGAQAPRSAAALCHPLRSPLARNSWTTLAAQAATPIGSESATANVQAETRELTAEHNVGHDMRNEMHRNAAPNKKRPRSPSGTGLIGPGPDTVAGTAKPIVSDSSR